MPATQEKHRHRVTRLRVSATSSIANALVVKHGGVFFLCQPDGQVPVGGEHGFGLYYHDCRFLNGYALRVHGGEFDLLASSGAAGFAASLELTTNDIETDENVIEKEQLGVRWDRAVDGVDLLLHDEIVFSNYGVDAAAFSLSLEFSAAFESVFAVRGLPAEKTGKLHAPSWRERCLRFLYDGADGLHRSVGISFSPAPSSVRGPCADFDIRIAPGEEARLSITLAVAESQDLETAARRRRRSRPSG